MLFAVGSVLSTINTSMWCLSYVFFYFLTYLLRFGVCLLQLACTWVCIVVTVVTAECGSVCAVCWRAFRGPPYLPVPVCLLSSLCLDRSPSPSSPLFIESHLSTVTCTFQFNFLNGGVFIQWNVLQQLKNFQRIRYGTWKVHMEKYGNISSYIPEGRYSRFSLFMVVMSYKLVGNSASANTHCS